MADAPTIFLSSTFYDLKQVRADLIAFLEGQLGHRALASELTSFPIDPAVDTIENCRKRVDEQADILVLIIGGRYGSVLESTGRSVTNTEYLAARAKRIPVYCFVDQDVLAVLPTWEANPTADFSATVDTPELFAFLQRVSAADRVWMFPFSSAQDIVSALRFQLAFLFKRGLTAQSRLREEDAVLRSLRGRSLSLAIDQPLGWQFKLFAQVLIDEVEAANDRRRAHDAGIAFGIGESVSADSVKTWASAQFARAIRLSTGLSKLINETVARSVGTTDIAQIVSGARLSGHAYSEALDWAAAVRRATVPDDWRPLAEEMALLINDILVKLETAGPELIRLVDDAVATPPEERKPIELTLTIEMANQEAFNREMAILQKKYGR